MVNCYMGLSRSASCVLAYLMTKQDMSLNKVSRYHALYCLYIRYILLPQALDYIKISRAVRPNEGFLKQLKVVDRRARY